MSTYTVQPGDDLSKIAISVYGTGCESNVQKIYQANKGVIGSNPAMLQPGQVLNIP